MCSACRVKCISLLFNQWTTKPLLVLDSPKDGTSGMSKRNEVLKNEIGILRVNQAER